MKTLRPTRWLLLGALALGACDDDSAHDTADGAVDEGDGDGRDGAITGDGDAPGDGDDQGDGDDPGDGDTDVLPATANSITTASAGMRNDPEGVASASPTTKLSWRDASGRERSLVLGGYLYQYDFSVDDNKQVQQRSANDDAYGHAGFGYVVSHNSQTGNSPLGKANTPSSAKSRVLSGGHHAIHRVELVYDRDKEGGGNGIEIPVVIDWFVATGRDHPIWAVTFKMAAAQTSGTNLDDYRMDTRAPYGSLNFDGASDKAAGDAIGGVSWGDAQYAFTTTGGGPLTLNSPWTYNTANRVNFTRMWTQQVNAEFGIVQTRPDDKELGYADRVVGRERGQTSAANYLGKGDCNALGDARNYSMPCIGGWPYQLMNYDWAGAKPNGEATGTKLIAWGSPYGYLGASSFSSFDYSSEVDGRGDRAYATFVVLGPKCRFDGAGQCNQAGDVALALAQVADLGSAELRVLSGGTVSMERPKGPGAASSKPLVNGYDDTYATFNLDATSAVSFTLTPRANGAVERPIFVVNGYQGKLPTVTVDDAPATINSGDANSDVFASVDATNRQLWLTLNRRVAAPVTLSVTP